MTEHQCFHTSRTVFLFFVLGLFLSHGCLSIAATPVTGRMTSVPVAKSDSGKIEANGGHYAGPSDEFNRGNPRSTVEGFLSYAAKGDFKDAAHYLDLRYLPRRLRGVPGAELARKLKIVLDRGLWVDPGTISDKPTGDLSDGLPASQESIGQIKTPEGTVNILLRRVPRGDGVKIWKFSNRTVAKIPVLYKYYGYRLFEERLSKIFPDVQVMGWQLWQWTAWLAFVAVAWIGAYLPTYLAALVIFRRGGATAEMLGRFISGPVRIILWLFLCRIAAFFLMPSAELKQLLNAGTILILALCWAGIKGLDILFEVWKQHMTREGRESSTVLLKPLRTVVRVSFVTIALLLWLDNIGFRVSALLAGLGVGGLAVALAAQGILKNLLGTVMILADRPYNVGERIVVKGLDGEVEEIGLRSTKIRLLTGHQASIPNDEIERAEIENIGRRPHIRRRQNIRLAIDTPPEKIERAVNIIREILHDHEGMKEDYPPRVYFDRFRDDALNIVMFYWYHPPEYWDFLDFSERTNNAILRAFEKEGIRLALPASTSFLAGAEGEQPLMVEAQTRHSAEL